MGDSVSGLCAPNEYALKEGARDKQVGGDHYKNSNHQPLEIVLETEGYEAFKGACLTKIYKYMQRKKANRLEDFRKAEHILGWLIEETSKRIHKNDLSM